jgi:hypothetical protein
VVRTELEAYFPEAESHSIAREWTHFDDLFLKFFQLLVSDPVELSAELTDQLEIFPLTGCSEGPDLGHVSTPNRSDRVLTR